MIMISDIVFASNLHQEKLIVCKVLILFDGKPTGLNNKTRIVKIILKTKYSLA